MVIRWHLLICTAIQLFITSPVGLCKYNVLISIYFFQSFAVFGAFLLLYQKQKSVLKTNWLCLLATALSVKSVASSQYTDYAVIGHSGRPFLWSNVVIRQPHMNQAYVDTPLKGTPICGLWIATLDNCHSVDTAFLWMTGSLLSFRHTNTQFHVSQNGKFHLEGNKRNNWLNWLSIVVYWIARPLNKGLHRTHEGSVDPRWRNTRSSIA